MLADGAHQIRAVGLPARLGEDQPSPGRQRGEALPDRDVEAG